MKSEDQKLPGFSGESALSKKANNNNLYQARLNHSLFKSSVERDLVMPALVVHQAEMPNEVCMASQLCCTQGSEYCCGMASRWC
jgi:hypothetical protein